MGDESKKILVVAKEDKVEALRMATGLTLLDDAVEIAVLGELDESGEEVQMQLEALDFAEVPIERLRDDMASYKRLTGMMIKSNAVLIV